MSAHALGKHKEDVNDELHEETPQDSEGHHLHGIPFLKPSPARVLWEGTAWGQAHTTAHTLCSVV